MKIKIVLRLIVVIFGYASIACSTSTSKNKSLNTEETWKIDFFDDFNSFESENWQDQRIWVNNEKQCYVPDGNFGTREVSEGTLKLKVVNIGSDYECDNLDKFGKKHPKHKLCSWKNSFKKSKRICKRKMDSKTQSSWR